MPHLTIWLVLLSILIPRAVGAFSFEDLRHIDLSRVSETLHDGGEIFHSLRKGVSDLTLEEEYYIGRSVTARILRDYKPVYNSSIQEYLDRVGGYLALYSRRPETFAGYHFQLFAADEVNAFSAPGGFILISTGLYRQIKTEDQLAAVLAHEIAHVTLRHGLKAIQKSNLTQAFTLIGERALTKNGQQDRLEQLNKLTSVFATSVDDIIQQLVISGYSREQELDADREALATLHRSGYNSQGLSTFLQQLEQQSGRGGFYATHPSATQRLQGLKRQLAVNSQSGLGQQAIRDRRFQEHLLP
ncbi:MAG: M48 family metalloprotease [Gammaproteobacteria bacterium]|nr:M48 family metalloprotease [Gammaproteobacteria bacterium]